MQLYRCKVRLKGSLLHEMPKIGVSAPEILILREIHQGDNEPVVEITPMGSNKKPGVNAAERDRLNSTYGPKIVERSEERRVGKECVRTCRSRVSPEH